MEKTLEMEYQSSQSCKSMNRLVIHMGCRAAYLTRHVYSICQTIYNKILELHVVAGVKTPALTKIFGFTADQTSV